MQFRFARAQDVSQAVEPKSSLKSLLLKSGAKITKNQIADTSI